MSIAALPATETLRTLTEQLRERFGRRAAALVAALAVECLLLLALLSLGVTKPPQKRPTVALSSFDVREAPKEEAKPQREPDHATAARQLPHPPQQPQPKPAEVTPPPPAFIPVSPQTMQSFDISRLPKAPAAPAPAKPLIGPADTPVFGDSERVGTAPNGQPMYAARWYREPTDQELSGYLATAQGPAWGLITCKTVADFRVDDCVGLDEYPQGSNMLRAILAAAWQFRVRPPQVGGVSQVGDWVRIRIDYELKPAGNPYGDPRKP